ncbi:hypothetical protein INT45_000018 [Circinella minor]|uniref:Uncharacterized protein n=1 Tax=Circinella minor TaxID=1195481 RepID=A0A8H7RWG6_9FUNG|nr:hypothetical protein INT45_000018 [Circinella minor]
MIFSKQNDPDGDEGYFTLNVFKNHDKNSKGVKEQKPFADIPPQSPPQEEQPSEDVKDDEEVVEKNEPQCHGNSAESVNRNADPNHTNAHLNFWRRLDNESVTAYQENWKSFMKSDGLPDQPDYQQTRGVVMVAGNRDTFERALTSVKMLRHQDCHLPVEIWHLPDELPSDATVEALNELGAVPRDLSESFLPRPMQYRRDTEKQFQIKAAAIINANFEQVLYLDSDNTPTRNPSFLFETSAFKATGAMFWPDFWKTHTENKIFEVLDISCKDEWEQESGQMVIDKTKSWLPLQLAWYMQEHSDLYFQFLNGDKDTFKYAWKALGVPYYMTETFLGMGGLEVETFCGHTMLQYSDNDEIHPLFVHANLMKITDKNGFMEMQEASNNDNQQQSFHERPWRQIKRYVNSKGVTNLSPGFRVAPGGKACMNFINGAWNEPETVIEEFDEVLPGFQNTYFELGGIGGEAR